MLINMDSGDPFCYDAASKFGGALAPGLSVAKPPQRFTPG